MSSRLSTIIQSNLEMLLSNAEKYCANVYKVMELREKLLWYYLTKRRQIYNVVELVNWFKNNKVTH